MIPRSGRSPGEGNDNPLQYSCLETPMDRGVWQATVHRVTKSRAGLSDFIFFLNKYLSVYCSVPKAWKYCVTCDRPTVGASLLCPELM